jgi:hypothetical protein
MRYSQAVLSAKTEYQSSTATIKKGPDLQGLFVVRLGGIEPPTCGLKGRCSLAPRRLPLTTELQAHECGPGL